MRLTPLDIKKQEFKKVMRGYDSVEVDAFLEMVADEFEATIREKNQLADEVLKLRTQLQDYQQVEKTLKETLVNAQENVSASRQTSKREADIILREAELSAGKIIENARQKLERLKNDLMIVKAQKESFARRLRHLLESQIELINVLEMDDAGYENTEPEDESTTPEHEPIASGTSLPAQGRRRVEIPLNKTTTTPIIRELGNRFSKPANDNKAAESSDTESKDNTEQKPRTPKISDQFIT